MFKLFQNVEFLIDLFKNLQSGQSFSLHFDQKQFLCWRYFFIGGDDLGVGEFKRSFGLLRLDSDLF